MDTGWVFCGNGANDTSLFTGDAAWNNPGYITADDTSYASVFLSGYTPYDSHALRAYNFNFGLPAGCTIDGIQARYWRDTDVLEYTGAYEVREQLVSGVGSAKGNNKSTGEIWLSSPVVEVEGGASDLWGASWSKSEVSSASFGFFIAVDGRNEEGVTCYCDYIQMKIFYTPRPSFLITNIF